MIKHVKGTISKILGKDDFVICPKCGKRVPKDMPCPCEKETKKETVH
jgi:ribosomal protein S26